MPVEPIPVEKILAILNATPGRIAELTVDLTPDQLQSAPAPDEWSAVELLAHLRACADVWGDYINRILTQDQPTIKAINPRTYISQTDYPEQAFHSSFQAFISQRQALLGVLEGLSPAEWQRSATVTGAGKPIQRTVQVYGDWIAVHERGHLRQFQKIVKQLRGE